MENLSRDLLKELFEYKDGQLFWKSKPHPRIDISKPAGSMRKDGYVQILIKRKAYRAHRLVFLMRHGYLPQEIDHIDGNPSNNAIENLRPATHSQNQHNVGKRKNNTSGYKGVNWDKALKKWRAKIRINGKRKHLGYFDCPKEAHSAYCQAANELHQQYANFG